MFFPMLKGTVWKGYAGKSDASTNSDKKGTKGIQDETSILSSSWPDQKADGILMNEYGQLKTQLTTV